MAVDPDLVPLLKAITDRLDVLEAIPMPLKGDPGPQGLKGDPGPQGIPGKDAVLSPPVISPPVDPVILPPVVSGAYTVADLFGDLGGAGPRLVPGASEGGHKAVDGEDLSGRRFSSLIVPSGVTCHGSDFVVEGSARYLVNVKSGGSLTADHWAVSASGSSKAVFVSGSLDSSFAIIHGGEDGIHQNGGDLTLTYSIVEDLEYPLSSHSDCFQQYSGGAGGTALISRCALICGFRMSNAPVQLNVGQGCTVTESYLSGGVYGINGDPGPHGSKPGYQGPVDIFDNWFAWGTMQYGQSRFGHTGSRWADASRRPRTISPWAYDSGMVPIPAPAENSFI